MHNYLLKEIDRVIFYAWDNSYESEECVNLLHSKGLDAPEEYVIDAYNKIEGK